MSPLGTIVGIDPSGKRLALFARGAGFSRAVPPAVVALRAEREAARAEEAESVLRDYVARHGLAGSAACLCVPAPHVFTARIAFPDLRERDLRSALALELERLFPVPPSRLLFGWRRLGKRTREKTVPLVVAAVSADIVERWREAAGRAGLALSGAVPSAWALAGGVAEIGGVDPEGIVALLRDAGGDTECALFAGGEPFFSAVRGGSGDAAGTEGIRALASGLSDAPAPPGAAGLSLLAPRGRAGQLTALAESAGLPVCHVSDFEARAARVLGLPEPQEEGRPVFELLGAFGAAARAGGIDWLAESAEDARSPAIRWLAAGLGAAALLLAVAWPVLSALRTRADAARLDREIAALRPAVAKAEGALAGLDNVEGRIAILREGRDGRGEVLFILRELTDRLPQRTWLTGLRVESRKVEIDGFSPAANEIFALLSRDGRFRKVEFASPITRQADNNERFQIRAEYVPPQSPAGGGRP